MDNDWNDEDRYFEDIEAPSRQAVAEAFTNYRPLDFHLFSDTENIVAAVDALCSELQQTRSGQGGHSAKIKRALKLTLANLCRNAGVDAERYTAYSRSKDGYRPAKRYNPFQVKWTPMIRVVDGLSELGHISNDKGFYYQAFGYGRLSRMRAQPAFIQFLQDQFGLNTDLIDRLDNDESIILRNENGRDIEYLDTAETNKMREELTAYNQLLDRSGIAVNLTDDEIQSLTAYPPDLSRKKVRRIFSRCSFELGGRFYGPWWQTARAIRPHILIDGEPTVECDYSAQHIHIAYSLLGTKYGDIHGSTDDPYSIPDLSHELRGVLKKALMIILNERTRNGAKAALRKWLRERTEYGPIDVPVVFDALENKHQIIQEYFYTDAGLTFQRIDSQISEFVIRKFTEAGIVVLDIHDSFITKRIHEDFLRQTMVEAFQANGLESIPPITNNL